MQSSGPICQNRCKNLDFCAIKCKITASNRSYWCWTYSHHCQIADKKPSKRWNGEFRGVRICSGWIPTTRFLLWVFMCSINFSFSGPLFRLPRRGLPRPPALFSGYHAEGYHAHTDTFKLTGYHVCRVTTPELPRSEQTSGYRRVITPAGSF